MRGPTGRRDTSTSNRGSAAILLLLDSRKSQGQDIAKAGWPVAEYKDHAVAHLGKNPKGLMSITKLDLHPDIAFDQGFEVEPADLDKMHQRAHRYCFIANSLSDSVDINIR